MISQQNLHSNSDHNSSITSSDSSTKCHQHSGDGSCCTSTPNPSLCQNLEELDFEKGIWQAALDNNTSKISHLIRYQNVLPDLLDCYGYTALHYAARNGKIEAAECLLDYGANINSQTKNGLATPLSRAVTANKIEMVKFLLSRQADTSVRDVDGLNAMDRAVKAGHQELVNLLEGDKS